MIVNLQTEIEIFLDKFTPQFWTEEIGLVLLGRSLSQLYPRLQQSMISK